ncbi:uncharacterized protein BKA55DRAFT_583545 [Fusarium redolens]|uniref:Uncharacterized protein n=1 Tax=Fusarium redolens TaxID=48865 RepID=A0A9P9JV83_FUSRE|nr:uncharacterized protein BKA55DRAFT_583545 [Fusarium redolens]KAH7230159.1 hypothetical protein BKA55DRAFT_583545 [Fusarium redolens]
MMCEKMKRGGIHVSSTAASVWPGSGLLAQRRAVTFLPPSDSTWTWRKGETAVTYPAKLLRTI